MKILILRFSSMGDVVLISPLLTTLKNHHPQAQITLVTKKLYADLFSDDDRIDSTRHYAKESAQKLFADLSSQGWDMVLDLQNSRTSRSLCRKYLSYAPLKSFNKLHLQRTILLLLRLNTYQKKDSVVKRYIDTAHVLNQKKIPTATLHFDNNTIPDCIPTAFTNSRDEPILGLFPFAAWNNKRWPQESFIAVGAHFIAKGFRIMIFGGPEDKQRADSMVQTLGERSFSCAGKLNLYQVGCMLKKCSLALGNDTGLSHLARACGVRTGVIFGATTKHFGFFPYGDPPFVVFETTHFCRPCHAHGGNRCWRITRPCLKKINVRQVISGLERLLNS